MSDIPITPETPVRRVPRWARWIVIGLIAAAVVLVGAIFLYAKVINDAPPPLSEQSLGDVLAEADSGTAVDTASATTATPTATAAMATGSTWVATAASEVGYRVDEVLFGVDTTAVGRTSEVTGTLALAGTQVVATEFTIDVASITSPESRRDEQFRSRIMSADEFPTATFVLTAPIELGVEPAEGAQVTTSATGDLTLRGVTLPVTFEVTALQQDGRIGVQGAIPVVFADYSIANPSFGGITTEDNGLVEFILVFQPA